MGLWSGDLAQVLSYSAKYLIIGICYTLIVKSRGNFDRKT